MAHIRRLKVLAGVSVCALILTACSPGFDVESGADSHGQSNMMALPIDNVAEVLKSIENAVVDDTNSPSDEKLASRLAEPALTIRKAQHHIAEKSNKKIESIDFNIEAVKETSDSQWPRVFTGVSVQEEGKLPFFYVISQQSPRDNYRLVSWTQLLADTDLRPYFDTSKLAVVDSDAQGFTVPPSKVISSYVEMLNNGQSGNDLFNGDEYSEHNYLKDARGLNDAAKEAGSVTQKASSNPEFPTVALQLDDGSMLVNGAFTFTRTYTRSVAHSKMRLGGTAAAITEGGNEVLGKVDVTYIANVLFRVPPAGKSGKITLIGATQVAESSRRDDSARPE